MNAPEAQPTRPDPPCGIPPDLDEWIATAVVDLCGESRARVRAEIEARFHEAMAAGSAAGKGDADAAREFLAALGNPNKAQDHYTRLYPTPAEASHLKRLIAWTQTPLPWVVDAGAVGFVLLFAPTTLLFGLRLGALAWLSAAAVASILGALFTWRRAGRQWRRGWPLARVLRVRRLALAFFLLPFVLVLFGWIWPIFIGMMLVALIVYPSTVDARAIRKLGRDPHMEEDFLPATIEDWLAVAGEGLTDVSRERIEAEIHAHYLDALDAEREAGHDEPAVARRALAALGSAEAARRRFQKAYFSLADVRRIEQLRKIYEQGKYKKKLVYFTLILANMTIAALMGLSLSALIVICWPRFQKTFDAMRALFIFKPDLKNAERKYRITISLLWTILIIPIGVNVLSMAQHRPEQGTLGLLRLWTTLLITLIVLSAWVGVIWSDFATYLPLLRKVRGEKTAEKELGPDQYA